MKQPQAAVLQKSMECTTQKNKGDQNEISR